MTTPCNKFIVISYLDCSIPHVMHPNGWIVMCIWRHVFCHYSTHPMNETLCWILASSLNAAWYRHFKIMRRQRKISVTVSHKGIAIIRLLSSVKILFHFYWASLTPFTWRWWFVIFYNFLEKKLKFKKNVKFSTSCIFALNNNLIIFR